jgi:hypothetical protein
MDPFQGATLAAQIAAIPVTTDADVLARVAEIIEPRARRERALWLFFFYEDGTQAPVVVPLGNMPDLPGDEDAEVAFHMLRHFYGLGEDDLSFVLAVCRDGALELTESDRCWLRVLQRAITEYAAPRTTCRLSSPSAGTVRWNSPRATGAGCACSSGPSPSTPPRCG